MIRAALGTYFACRWCPGTCGSGGGRSGAGGAVRGHHNLRLGHLRLREPNRSTCRRCHEREPHNKHYSYSSAANSESGFQLEYRDGI